MTRQQKRGLANLLLAHGFDVVTEFWDEVTQNWDDRPDMDEAFDVVHKWCKPLIDMACKG